MGARKTLSIATATCALCVAANVHAGMVLPGFDWTVSVDGAVDASFDAGDGAATGDPTIFEWTESTPGATGGGSGWNLGNAYNVTVDTDQRRVSMAFGFENETLTTHTYTLRVIAPVDPIAGGSLYGGFATGTLNDANFDGNAQVTSGDNIGAFNGLIDGSPLLSLLDDLDISVDTPGGGATIPAENQPANLVGPAVLNDIGIEISFTLTPGDTVSFNAAFIVTTPAPAALALFGIAGLRGRRRRD